MRHALEHDDAECRGEEHDPERDGHRQPAVPSARRAVAGQSQPAIDPRRRARQGGIRQPHHGEHEIRRREGRQQSGQKDLAERSHDALCRNCQRKPGEDDQYQPRPSRQRRCRAEQPFAGRPGQRGYREGLNNQHDCFSRVVFQEG